VGSVANGRIGLQAVAMVIRGSSRRSGRSGRSGRARRQIQKHVSHNYRGATGFQLSMHRQETNNRKLLTTVLATCLAPIALSRELEKRCVFVSYFGAHSVCGVVVATCG
jgi:hypothetical protein